MDMTVATWFRPDTANTEECLKEPSASHIILPSVKQLNKFKMISLTLLGAVSHFCFK